MKKQKELEETETLTTVDAVEEELARAPGRTAKQEEASSIDILQKQPQVQQPGKQVTVSLKANKLLRELIEEGKVVPDKAQELT